MLTTLRTHRVNTLTELCRIERAAATCEHSDDAAAFQAPMTAAWDHYVSSNQLLTELRGLTPSYPFSGDVIPDALARVRADPESNRSWNLAWLVLVKIRDEDLIAGYAVVEATRPGMWGGREPTDDEAAMLCEAFVGEWTAAVDTMLRHWAVEPTWC